MNKLLRMNAKDHVDPEQVRTIDFERNDSRASVRYSLDAEVTFHWRGPGGLQRQAFGYTRDISHKGEYVVARECPCQGTRVSVYIHLPQLVGEKRVLRIEAEGHVLRVEASGDRENEFGFAVSNDRVNLRAAAELLGRSRTGEERQCG
jgi:hypothetical protein